MSHSPQRKFPTFWFFAVALLIAIAIAATRREAAPASGFVLVQTPLTNTVPPRDALDGLYPAGSRVVLASVESKRVRVLSRGLYAAGEPVVRLSLGAVLFAGKATRHADWQIFETKLAGGAPRQLTFIDGGAMNPAELANGALVFSSPVPVTNATTIATSHGRSADASSARTPPPTLGLADEASALRVDRPPPSSTDARRTALYVQSGRTAPQRITFGLPATHPTVLRDGRILFVSPLAGAEPGEARPGLFTVNSDGTELSLFAAPGDAARSISRPRELPDGRIGFIASDTSRRWIETVRLARPFQSRAVLLSPEAGSSASVEPGFHAPIVSLNATNSAAVFTLGANGQLGLIFDDPLWNDLDATPLQLRPKPMGHLSTINPARRTGTILCLNANFMRGATNRAATRSIRVVAGPRGERLGEVPVEADGSFLAEVPADTPIGFEALDVNHRVIATMAPSFWVRPGENRSCVGCHEPYNRSPRNHRPIAANKPPVSITGGERVLARGP